MWFMFVISFIIFFVIFLVIARNLFAFGKKTGDMMNKMMKNVTDTVSAYPEEENPIEILIPVQPKESDYICEYCGNVVKAGETKCNTCGARTKKK